MSRDALVVGINTYQHLPLLRAPAHDAEAIAQCLQTHGEFRVHRLPEIVQNHQPRIGQKTHVTLRQLESALINLFKPKGQHVPHTALFYFSGHGMQRDAGIQEGYLAVSDSAPDVGFSGLSLFWLRRLLQESPVRQRIVILDCCHSGELLNFLEADPGAKPGTDRLFMAASRDYEPAYEALESPYSMFTQAVLDGLHPQHSETGIVTNHTLTSWVNHALKGEIQQPLFESSGSEIILTRSSQTTSIKRGNPSSEVCPYRGLEFFDEPHAEYFFGRSELTDQLIEKLRSGRFVSVVGASGSGKSSLIRAGLIRELRQGQKFSGSDLWRIRLMTPTEHPLKSLAAVFIDPNLSELERAEHLRRAEAFLQDGSVGLSQLVRASLLTSSPTSIGPRPHLLLVIDQFEEIFTLCHGPHAEQQRQHFFSCLLEAVQNADHSLSIVVVLRADFLGKCSLYSNLAQQIEQNLVMVTPMTYEQIKSTIVKPAQKAGLVCEPNLVYTMLLDVVGAPGELPLLQYTLSELWKRRETDTDSGISTLTLDAYTELGGIRGTLQKRATEIFNSLSADEQIVAKRIFLALTQLGEGTEDTRRRVPKSELVSVNTPLRVIEQTLEKLVTAKLIVTNQGDRLDSQAEPHIPALLASSQQGSRLETLDTPLLPLSNIGATVQTLVSSSTYQGESNATLQDEASYETIDVVHEALIRNWSLLRGWLEENRELLRRQRRIEHLAREWDSANQPTGAEYLLRGSRLVDAEDFLDSHSEDLSILAQRYITVSAVESQRARKESRLLQFAVPSVLLVALMVTLNQYRSAMQTQAEKNYQLQVATSRERAAIAQSILQEPHGDPMAALLISRLTAVEGERTYEVQASLRAAFRRLRLQFMLQGHTGAVHQMRFSSDQKTLATASADGTIRLWAIDPQTVYTTAVNPATVLEWRDSSSESPEADLTLPEIKDIAFSAKGDQLAAIAQDENRVKLWSVGTGRLIRHLDTEAPTQSLAMSATGNWLAAATAQTVWLWHADTGEVETRLTQIGVIRQVEFSPDGRQLLVSSNDGNVRLWSLSNTPSLAANAVAISHPAAVLDARFSPDGQLIATVCRDGHVRLWNAQTRELVKLLTASSQENTAIDNSSESVSASQSNLVAEVGVSNGSTSLPHPIESGALEFSPDGQTLAVTRSDQPLTIWQRDKHGTWSMKSLRGLKELGNQTLNAFEFSPDSQFLMTGNQTSLGQERSDFAAIWDMQTGEKAADLRGTQTDVMASAFSPNGLYVITANEMGNIAFWTTEEGGELPTISEMQGTVQWLSFEAPPTDEIGATPSQTQTDIITVTGEGVVRQWKLLSDPLPSYAERPEMPSMMNVFAGKWWPQSPSDSKYSQPIGFHSVWQQLRETSIAILHPYQTKDEVESKTQSISNASLISTTDAPAGGAFTEWAIASKDAALTAVAFAASDRLIAAATQQGWLDIYRANSSHQLLHRIQNPTVESSATGKPTLHYLTFSADNQLLLGVGADAMIRVWSVQSGNLLQILQGHTDAVQHARFSLDGRYIVSAGFDQTARIWEVSSGKLLKTIPHQAAVTSANFSPHHKLVATASIDGTIRIWDVETGAIQVVFSGHRGSVLDVNFSPDGRSLVTASQDGTVRLWDAKTGTEQAQLRPSAPGEDSVPMLQSLFSPDGHYIAALSEDGNVHLWAATWEMMLKLASDRSLRTLTPDECIRYLRLTPEACP
jgi:WD40 repeat protein/energy-coupling factor transporter ATP-binding protein EcfA2